MKAKMLAPDEVLSLVGHPVGGVCPFGINDGIDVYLDESLKRFDTVFRQSEAETALLSLTLKSFTNTQTPSSGSMYASSPKQRNKE